MRLLTALLAGALSVTALAQAPPKPKVYLGAYSQPDLAPIPPEKDVAKSYKELREEWARQPDIKAAFDLTDTPKDADVAVTVIIRGKVTNLTYLFNGKIRFDLVPGLGAKLTVPGTNIALELDGTEGLQNPSYREAARNTLKQTARWIASNQQTLNARREKK